MYRQALLMAFILGGLPCRAQHSTTMEQNSNALLCEPDSGVCTIPVRRLPAVQTTAIDTAKPVKILYFTDPICSSCWGIEPQLRRLKLEYGADVDIEYRMGGLLPDWSYNSGGISKPADVAHHWDEVSAHYQMPIDGDVWLEDPLHSSYPPSIAFKAAQLQDEQQALVLLRVMREMVFLEKKNIAKWEHIEAAAIRVGLDIEQLKQDYNGRAQKLFQDDLELAAELGVHGFPTMVMTNSNKQRELVYGARPYAALVRGIAALYPAAKRTAYAKDWESLFAKYPTLTTREFAELSDISFAEAEIKLQVLLDEGELAVWTTKNGVLWKRK